MKQAHNGIMQEKPQSVEQVQEEVSVALAWAQAFHDFGFANDFEIKNIRRRIKAWAYDQLKEVQKANATDNTHNPDRHGTNDGRDGQANQVVQPD